MSYNVKIKQFEGPFELLISLIQDHKLKAQAVPVSQIAEEYNEAISAQTNHSALDLEITSDFLIVATVLIRLKMNEALDLGDLLDEADDEQGELFESNQPTLREALLERLLQYKQFAQAAHYFSGQLELAERSLPRPNMLEDRYLNILPDYLEQVQLSDIARTAAEVLARKETFLLEQQHITAKPVDIALAISRIEHLLQTGDKIDFAELVQDMAKANNSDSKSVQKAKNRASNPYISETVACFLGVLELYRTGRIKLEQSSNFGRISIQTKPSKGEK